MTLQSSSKQARILATLSAMLEKPDAGHITTAALAKQLNQSEAALYRHYVSKAAIFEDLIAQIRDQILEDLQHIEATESNGRTRLHKQLHALLLFVERHRGTARVLTGGALVNEAPSLQARVNQVTQEIEDVLAASAGYGIEQASIRVDEDARILAGLLMNWVLGCWLRYVQTDWQAAPTTALTQHLALLGL